MNIKAVLAIIQIVGSLILAWLQQRPREDTEQKAKDDAIQKRDAEIDAAEPDFDSAIDRLRERANRGTKGR